MCSNQARGRLLGDAPAIADPKSSRSNGPAELVAAQAIHGLMPTAAPAAAPNQQATMPRRSDARMSRHARAIPEGMMYTSINPKDQKPMPASRPQAAYRCGRRLRSNKVRVSKSRSWPRSNASP